MFEVISAMSVQDVLGWTLGAMIGSILAMGAAQGVAWVLWWMDDFESRRPRNALLLTLNRMRGLREQLESDGSYSYYNRFGAEVDPDWMSLVFLLACTFAPATVYLFNAQPVLPLVLVTATVMVFIGRTMRRYKKMFNKHVVDPNAHCNSEEKQ